MFTIYRFVRKDPFIIEGIFVGREAFLRFTLPVSFTLDWISPPGLPVAMFGRGVEGVEGALVGVGVEGGGGCAGVRGEGAIAPLIFGVVGFPLF